MKHLKPLNNSSRNTVLTDYKSVLQSTVKKYPKKLFKKITKNSGRNNRGVITTRHQGGGHKQTYRIVDFKRYNNDGVLGTVKSIEYSPHKSCFISFISFQDGKSSFILSPVGLKVGDKIISGNSADVPIKVGNNLPLKFIPIGTMIHNIELKVLKGGQIARSAGTYAQITGHEEGGKYVIVKLGSKEVRRIFALCRATIGRVGNENHNLIKLGKAGRTRWSGKRPTVRGSAMNPIDHPHGGGEGKSPIGRKSPLTPWGKKTLGKKTRTQKTTDKYILKSRHKR